MDKTFSPRVHSCSLVAAAAIVATVALASAPAAAQCSATGSVWFVDTATASTVSFPVPSATPDATFTWGSNGANFTAFGGNGPKSNNFEIGDFLTKGGSPVQNLQFSGLKNPYLGDKKAKSSTPLFANGYGALIELTNGPVCGIPIGTSMLHSDGGQVMINGTVESGFTNTAGEGPTIEINDDGSTVGEIDYLYGLVSSTNVAVGTPNIGQINLCCGGNRHP